MKQLHVKSVKDMCFYIFLVCILLYYSFRKALVDYSVFDFSLYLSIPFFALKFLLEDRYTVKEFVINIVLIVLGIISTLIISNTSILISFCIVIGMKNIDYKTALKFVFWIRLVTCILIMLGTALGVIQNLVETRESGMARYSMGYAHPNTFGIYCFVIISLWFILYGEKHWKMKVVVASLVNIFQFMLTNSRTSFLLILLFLCMVVYSKCIRNTKLFARISPYVMIIFFLVNLLMPLTLNYAIGSVLNDLLNSRVSLSGDFLRVYGIDWFGQIIANKTGENGYWHLDSGFLNLFLQFGAVIGIVYLILCFMTAKNTRVYNNYVHIAIIMFSLYGIIEDVLSSFLYSYLWIIIGAAYYIAVNKKKKNKNINILEILKLKEYKL